MSTSQNPEKFMAKLLDLLSKAKKSAKTDEADVQKIEVKLKRVKDDNLLSRVKLFDQIVFGQFTAVERRLGNIVVGAKTTYSDINKTKEALDLIDKDVQKIIDDISQPQVHLPTPEPIPESDLRRVKPEQFSVAEKMPEEWLNLGLEARILENPAMAQLKRTYEDLESIELKMCFLSFSIFPDGSVIKKRPLIYWWIGEGFVRKTRRKTAEEVGEEIFEKLISKGFISPTNSALKDCKLHPWIRRMLISLASEAKLFPFGSREPSLTRDDILTCRRVCLVDDPKVTLLNDGLKLDDVFTVFNIDILYLNLKKDWLAKLNKVAVLQLGRWQSSASYHIELKDEGSLKDLRTQKQLKYLSLRGISRITELPSSILHLPSLEILDLRACHNLEKLPSDVSSLKSLTHLDLSECYLLEGMPKGLEKLSALQVLKGFVIGSVKNTPCRLGDLVKLKKLRRLSIHMGNEAVVQEKEFEKLKNISTLRRLKISWGVVSKSLKEEIRKRSLEISLPSDLEKLDLQGMPLETVPNWLKPNNLARLKKLYIRGGELASLDHGETDKWTTVEVLHLKYLKKLEIGRPKLDEVFPRLQRLEKINCHRIGEKEYDRDIVF